MNRKTRTEITGDGNVVGDNNIVRIIKAAIHMPVWAWVSSVAILAVAVILVGSMFNIDPLRDLLPTPMPFEPAQEGESLIIVADFEDRSDGKYQGMDPAQYIYERLVEQAQADGLDVRIERLREVVDDNTVRATGELYSATLVLWGWYDIVGITPRLGRIGVAGASLGCPDCQESVQRLDEPGTVDFDQIILESLPERTGYLVSFTMGLDAYNHNDLERALTYLNSALEIAEQDVGMVTVDEAYFYRGKIHDARGQYTLAIADYDAALGLNPGLAQAYHSRGITYHKIGEYSAALSDLNRTLEIDESACVYYNRGRIYHSIGEYDRALTDFNRALSLDAEFASASNNRGVIYAKNGEYEKALADFNQALEVNHKDSAAYANRGHVYQCMGKYEKALEDYDCALRLDPELDIAYYNRGNIYQCTGEYEKALADYNHALELNPKFAEAYYNRGLTYKQLEQKEQAIADFEHALELTTDPQWRQNVEEQLHELRGE